MPGLNDLPEVPESVTREQMQAAVLALGLEGTGVRSVTVDFGMKPAVTVVHFVRSPGRFHRVETDIPLVRKQDPKQ